MSLAIARVSCTTTAVKLNPSLTGKEKHVSGSLPAPLFCSVLTFTRNNKHFGGHRLPGVKAALRNKVISLPLQHAVTELRSRSSVNPPNICSYSNGIKHLRCNHGDRTRKRRDPQRSSRRIRLPGQLGGFKGTRRRPCQLPARAQRTALGGKGKGEKSGTGPGNSCAAGTRLPPGDTAGLSRLSDPPPPPRRRSPPDAGGGGRLPLGPNASPAALTPLPSSRPPSSPQAPPAFPQDRAPRRRGRVAKRGTGKGRETAIVPSWVKRKGNLQQAPTIRQRRRGLPARHREKDGKAVRSHCGPDRAAPRAHRRSLTSSPALHPGEGGKDTPAAPPRSGRGQSAAARLRRSAPRGTQMALAATISEGSRPGKGGSGAERGSDGFIRALCFHTGTGEVFTYFADIKGRTVKEAGSSQHFLCFGKPHKFNLQAQADKTCSTGICSKVRSMLGSIC